MNSYLGFFKPEKGPESKIPSWNKPWRFTAGEAGLAWTIVELSAALYLKFSWLIANSYTCLCKTLRSPWVRPVSVFWVAMGISILSFTGSGSPLDKAEKYLTTTDISEGSSAHNQPLNSCPSVNEPRGRQWWGRTELGPLAQLLSRPQHSALRLHLHPCLSFSVCTAWTMAAPVSGPPPPPPALLGLL